MNCSGTSDESRQSSLPQLATLPAASLSRLRARPKDAGFPLGYIALLAGSLVVDPLVQALNRLRHRSEGVGTWAATTVLTAVPVVATVLLAVKAASDAGGY